MAKQSQSSTPPSGEPMNPLERAALELNNQLRASGRTVTVQESSDSTELKATFVPARQKPAKPRGG